MRVYKTGELHVSIRELRKLADELEQEMRDFCKSMNWKYNKEREKSQWIISICSDCPLHFFHDDTWSLDHRKNKFFDNDEEFDKSLQRHIKRLKRTIKFYEESKKKEKELQ